MSRRFTLVTLGLTATVAFLVGLIVAGSLVPAPAVSQSAVAPAKTTVRAVAERPAAALVNFADVAERINPAVVNIEATSPGADLNTRRRSGSFNRDLFEEPFDLTPPRNTPTPPRRGSGSGFVIEPAGFILTNHHVIDGAERITVKFSSGRSLRARVVGTDPDTDIALIKVDGAGGLPSAPLGNSDALRVGEWVCAIGNPLAYEHTVTVGVVSYIGRKLFDSSLDNYIQTDAAINFGNSGGPLINAQGDVVGINSAISSRASNIGFAVPINQASAILPQLKTRGRVSRGYIGVALKDVDPDLQRSLKLSTSRGALVQDVTEGSPGQRAGLRAYDLIVSIDGRPVASNDDLIREVARHAPGAVVRLQILRDGRPRQVMIKLAERPGRQSVEPSENRVRPSVNPPRQSDAASPLGLSVRELDRDFLRRNRVPRSLSGVVVSRVEPMSSASDVGIERGYVLMEINRQPVMSVEAYRRIARAARPGDVLALYVYIPDLDQRALRTVQIEAR